MYHVTSSLVVLRKLVYCKTNNKVICRLINCTFPNYCSRHTLMCLVKYIYILKLKYLRTKCTEIKKKKMNEMVFISIF